MSSRPSKRQRFSDIKNQVVNDVHKLTVDVGEFNNDLMNANEDFVLMFKSMEDRQSVLLTRSLLIEENYREVADLIKNGKSTHMGGSTSTEGVLPSTYSGDTRRFVADAARSLEGHAEMYRNLVKEIDTTFKKYVVIWEEKIADFTNHTENVTSASATLRAQLFDYGRSVGDSDI